LDLLKKRKKEKRKKVRMLICKKAEPAKGTFFDQPQFKLREKTGERGTGCRLVIRGGKGEENLIR